MTSVFLSFARSDEPFVRRIREDLSEQTIVAERSDWQSTIFAM